MAIDSLTGGAFQTPAGSPVSNGNISFTLSSPAVVNNTGQVVQNQTITYSLDSTGNIAANSNLWGNDQLVPLGTFYIVSVADTHGSPVRGPENWVIAGTSPVNLTNIIAASPAISYSGAVLLTPLGTQVITTGWLNPNSGASQSLGSPSSPWNAVLATANINVANIANGFSSGGLTTVANLNVSGYLNVIGAANLQVGNITNLYATVATLPNLNVGKVTAYENVATQGAGVPYIVAQNLTANLQTNFNGGTTKVLYQTVASGMYRLSATFSVINTPVAANGPNLVLSYTDAGGVPRSQTIWAVMGTVSSNANVQSNVYPMFCAQTTNINVTSQGYTPGSGGGGGMAYALGLTVEGLT